jgi:hypothetical protein
MYYVVDKGPGSTIHILVVSPLPNGNWAEPKHIFIDSSSYNTWCSGVKESSIVDNRYIDQGAYPFETTCLSPDETGMLVLHCGCVIRRFVAPK